MHTSQLSNRVRACAREDIFEGLKLVQRFLNEELSIDAFVKAFESFFYQRALDGHEDPEGPIDHDVIRHTLALRVLQDAQSVLDRLFDEAGTSSPETYVANGRIRQAELRETCLRTLSQSMVSLALETLESE
ncbi:MAG: hypothetical protein AB7T06_29630 [Kofleriaceae bacterium]